MARLRSKFNEGGPASRCAPAWAVLAFTSGFIDTVGFIVLFGLFTTHLTGNLAVLGAQLATGQGGMLAKILAVPVFLAVVAVTTVFADRARGSLRGLSACFVAEGLILLSFMVLGLHFVPFDHADAPAAVLTSLTGIAAMAVRNAGCRIHLPNLPPATVMTGNLTQLVVDLTRWLSHRPASGRPRHDAANSLKRLLPGLGGFMAGSLAGAGLHALFGFWAMWIPIIGSFSLAQLAWQRARRRNTWRVKRAKLQPWAPTRILHHGPTAITASGRQQGLAA